MVEVIRGIIRPLVTLLGFIVLAALAAYVVVTNELPEAVLVGIVTGFVNLVGVAVAFWFSQRNQG